MALVSGGRSTLNPNAPLFIPAAFQQVEDFSPEWWELVQTSKWFHDYWLNQHQEQEIAAESDDDDIANLLPESLNLGIADEFLSFEMPMEDSAHSARAEESALFAAKREIKPSGLELKPEAMVKNLSLKSPKEAAKY